MAEEKTTKQVNVNFEKDPDLLTALDEMVQEDESDRSKFIRRLIRQETVRRQQESQRLVRTPRSSNARGVAA